ncbi:unnamed protein product [Leptosia nina]|uniref:Uncharacterized protein n=1 Tax=Leptosia nina TaxID=320188 RepID=A0AAV1JZ03_9NEOP
MQRCNCNQLSDKSKYDCAAGHVSACVLLGNASRIYGLLRQIMEANAIRQEEPVPSYDALPMELKQFIRRQAYEFSFLANNRIYDEQEMRLAWAPNVYVPMRENNVEHRRVVGRSCGEK